MSQGTPINNLGTNQMSQDDSRLVDSILNDLNNSRPQQSPQQAPQQAPQQPNLPQGGGAPQQMTPDQHKAMLAQRQQQMMQQQIMQQQQMQQMQKKKESESILDKIQGDWKNIVSIIVLSVIVNTSMVDGLFRMNDMTYFLSEAGTLNFQAVIVKALVVAVMYFIIKNFVPL